MTSNPTLNSRDTSGSDLTFKERKRALIAVVLCISVAGITMGFTHPLVSLILEKQNTSSGTIGLIGSMFGFATALYSPLVPRGIKRLGMRNFILTAMVLQAAMFLTLNLFPWPWAWAVIRFVMGGAVAGLFVASETWINQLASPHNRGRLLAIYNIVLGIGFAMGPLLINLTGTEGWAPFLTGAGVIVAATLPMLGNPNSKPDFGNHQSFSPITFIKVAPALCAAVILTSGTDTLVSALLPVFTTREGYSVAEAASMITVFFTGGILLQYPFGWLADLMPSNRLLGALGLGTLASSLLILLFPGQESVMWVAVFLWGGCSAGIYNTALAAVGQNYRGNDLMAANAAFGFLWGIGALATPFAGGLSMELFGDSALLGLAVAINTAFLGLLIATRQRHRPL